MKNVAIMLGLLLGAFTAARVFGAETAHAGAIAIAVVFFFTALGHFVKADAMMAMLPPSWPAPRATVLLSGGWEILLGVGLLGNESAYVAGWATIGFLILVTPLNIDSAARRVDFGGHGAGVRYLWVRLPLQVILIGWTYWFVVRDVA